MESKFKINLIKMENYSIGTNTEVSEVSVGSENSGGLEERSI